MTNQADWVPMEVWVHPKLPSEYHHTMIQRLRFRAKAEFISNVNRIKDNLIATTSSLKALETARSVCLDAEDTPEYVKYLDDLIDTTKTRIRQIVANMYKSPEYTEAVDKILETSEHVVLTLTCVKGTGVPTDQVTETAITVAKDGKIPADFKYVDVVYLDEPDIFERWERAVDPKSDDKYNVAGWHIVQLRKDLKYQGPGLPEKVGDIPDSAS